MEELTEQLIEAPAADATAATPATGAQESLLARLKADRETVLEAVFDLFDGKGDARLRAVGLIDGQGLADDRGRIDACELIAKGLGKAFEGLARSLIGPFDAHVRVWRGQ